VSAAQRGKDGHLTLNTKGGGGGDFFSNPAGDLGAGRKRTGDITAVAAKPAAAPASTAAQQKFGNVKAISSKDFEEGGKDR
jgi:hypothetical protein